MCPSVSARTTIPSSFVPHTGFRPIHVNTSNRRLPIAAGVFSWLLTACARLAGIVRRREGREIVGLGVLHFEVHLLDIIPTSEPHWAFVVRRVDSIVG